MTVKATFINDNLAHDAIEFTDYFKQLVSNGVFAKPATGLFVEQALEMNVKVKAGFGFVDGVLITNTDDLELTIDTTTTARVDRVVFGVDQSTPSAGIYVLKGTENSTTAPVLANGTSKKELCLAEITVAPSGIIKVEDKRHTTLCGVVTNLLGEFDATGVFAAYQNEFNKVIASGKNSVNVVKNQAEAAFEGFYNSIYSNAIINGAFNVDQRGNGAVHAVSTGQKYTLDRWLARLDGSSNGQISVQRYKSADNKNVLRINNKALNSDGMFGIGQFIENGAALFAGGAVTVSFKAKSTVAQKLAVNLQIKYNASNIVNYTQPAFDVTEDWQEFAVTFEPTLQITDDTNNAKMTIFSAWSGDTANSRFSTSDANGEDCIIYISDVVVCKGSLPMPYSPQHYSDELERCRRYYRKYGFTTLLAGQMKSDKSVKTQAIDFSGMRVAPALVTTDMNGTSGKASWELITTGIEHGHGATPTSNSDGFMVAFVINSLTTSQVQAASIAFNSIEADSEIQ